MAETGTGADPGRLDVALSDLVARGVIGTDQAAEVRRAYLGAGAAPAPAAPGAGDDRGRRGRLVEGAAYLGAVLVAASLLVIVGQRWADLSDAGRIGLLVVLGAVAAVAGLVVVRTLPGGRLALTEPAHAARRRVASVLLTLAAGLLTAAVGVALGDRDITVIVVALTALALVTAGELVAPSALAEAVMFGAAMVAVGSIVAEVVPDPAETGGFLDERPPAAFADYATQTAVAIAALVWALLVARLLRVPQLGVVLGLVVALWSVVALAGDERTRTWGLVLLAGLALLGLVAYLVLRTWPWLALVVLSTTAFVALLVQDAAGPAVAFLVAGLVLLAGAALGARFGRRPDVPA